MREIEPVIMREIEPVIMREIECDYGTEATVPWHMLLSGCMAYVTVWLHGICYCLVAWHMLLSGCMAYVTVSVWLHGICYHLYSCSVRMDVPSTGYQRCVPCPWGWTCSSSEDAVWVIRVMRST